MKSFCLYLIIICGALLAAGCHDKVVEPPIDPTPQPRAEAERTVIIYMAADNTLDDYPSSAQADTTEMAKSKNQIPENVNFIVYLDDLKQRPAIYELSAKGGMQLWKQYDEELSSTDSLTMLTVLREIEHYFPARHYGITFWSHATGWAPRQSSSRRNTFGQDKHPNKPGVEDEMEITDLRDVLSQLPKFDYIFFDACFMQCIEVAYELRGATDCLIGSPAEIPGPGAPYDRIVGALCQGDADGIIQGYDSGYPYLEYPGVLLSRIDCTKLDALAEITGQLLTPFFMGRVTPDLSDFQPYCNDLTWSSHLTRFTYCFDMRTTMCRLLSEENQEDYAAWMEVFDEAVPVRKLSADNRWRADFCNRPYGRVNDPDCYGGVSMFLPLEIYDRYGWNEHFRQTAWYEAAGWENTGW